MAKKHILMLKTFVKVMLGFKKETNLIIPNSYLPSIYQIDYNKLRKNNIDTLLFDIDNTITKVDDLKVPKETINLFQDLKQNFKILLISNNHKERVEPVAKQLNVKALWDAGKPENKVYDKALEMLNSSKENTVAIGDQILSDIVGANKYGLKSILVDQLSKENNIQTGMAQKLQKHMVKKLTKKNLFKKGKYYWKQVKIWICGNMKKSYIMKE